MYFYFLPSENCKYMAFPTKNIMDKKQQLVKKEFGKRFSLDSRLMVSIKIFLCF